MKRRFACVFITVLASVMLAACGSSGELQPDENTFYVSIANQCDSEIYGLHYEYYLGEEPIGGGFVTYASNKPIRENDVLSEDFIAAYFPEDSDLSAFRTEVFVILEDGQESSAGEPLAIDADYGQVYNFSLYGSDSEGFYLIEDES